ncbi:MAG: hypothetical protein EOO09_06790 [Chitinophagaceae bacterium]|nr:MAG: hypothetical protein EOO09_06790 [Chitinophagaceae bacterium]
MKPLIVLIAVSALAAMATWLITGAADLPLAGRIGMAAMLVFTAIGHFVFTRGMVMMVPAAVPFKKEMVIATGLIEILAAGGLLLPGFVQLTGWLLILFFLLILPANIYAAKHKVNHEAGNHEGKSTRYLWFRIPLQLLFIAWVYFSAIHN